MTVRRKAPNIIDVGGDYHWVLQCLADLMTGEHAVGCNCWQHPNALRQTATGAIPWNPNGCLRIASCARDLVSYEIQTAKRQGVNRNAED